MGSPRRLLRIFVSHSHQDDAFGLRLAQDLRRFLGNENTVWYDTSNGLHPGDNWWDKIIDELTSRDVFIVLLSPDAVSSPWVKDEIRIAWRQKNDPARGKLIFRFCVSHALCQKISKFYRQSHFCPRSPTKPALFNFSTRSEYLPAQVVVRMIRGPQERLLMPNFLCSSALESEQQENACARGD